MFSECFFSKISNVWSVLKLFVKYSLEIGLINCKIFNVYVVFLEYLDNIFETLSREVAKIILVEKMQKLPEIPVTENNELGNKED